MKLIKLDLKKSIQKDSPKHIKEDKNMGCWNETCGFSGQSILAGEKVTAFLILLNEAPYRDVYAQGTASPIAFPIEAEYDDYGSIENPTLGFATESALKLFNHWSKEGKLILNDDFFDRDSDRAEDFDRKEGFQNIETLFYAIERDYVSLKQYNYESREVTHGVYFMLVKQEVLDSMIETVLDCDDYDFRHTSTETYNAEVQHMLDKCVIGKKKLLSDTFEYQYPWGGDSLDSPIEDRRWNVCMTLGKFESVNTTAFRILFNITKELYTPENNDDIKQSLMRFFLTHNAMSLFRKFWTPQAHASQHDNFPETIEYMERLLTKMYKRRIEQYEKGWWEDVPKDKIYNHPSFI